MGLTPPIYRDLLCCTRKKGDLYESHTSCAPLDRLYGAWPYTRLKVFCSPGKHGDGRRCTLEAMSGSSHPAERFKPSSGHAPDRSLDGSADWLLLELPKVYYLILSSESNFIVL